MAHAKPRIVIIAFIMIEFYVRKCAAKIQKKGKSEE
jgi:hypothetical protein